ncbi:hypothetical protein Q1695_001470 [Nippostrongylus brasiliensis]|nr:hypothetical protein Q1695_001470 [Nippostrongylus brasiliensis]
MHAYTLAQFFFYCAICARASPAENRLYREILSNYNKLVRPVRYARDKLKVEMKVFLQQIMNLDGKNQIVELNAWLEFTWMDYRLSWNESKYDNVKSIRFAGGENQIWRPDVLLYNSANEDFDSTFKSNEVVYSSGEVNWIPPGIFRASCKMDITYFPFDDQLCYLKFGSWTYSGDALDLRILSGEDEEPSMDLSTYTPSGEWHLKSAPAFREVLYSPCCPEPYSTVTFYMLLRRRSVFYLFNIVFPSLLISLMTLVGFCLPAHDMSEKIGYQTTILLSICFFVTIVSEMTPPTSESVPLLGVFFSTLTLIVSVSTAFTITVLHCRYRQPQNAKMTRLFRAFFLEWLPKTILLNSGPKKHWKLNSPPRGNDNYQPAAEVSCTDSREDLESFLYLTVSSLQRDRNSFETLNLQRKIGDGILKKRRPNEHLKRSLSTRLRDTPALHNLWRSSASFRVRSNLQSGVSFIQCYSLILERLRQIRQRSERLKLVQMEQEEWKFAALALDRLCLILYTFLVIVCSLSIAISSPYFS